MGATVVRDAFVAGASGLATLLEADELKQRWSEPSALAGFATSGLAGHLVRAVTATVDILERPEPDGEPMDVTDFFVAATSRWDDQAGGIVERGDQQAAGGVERLVHTYRASATRLGELLDEAPPERRVLRHGRVLILDDFLVVRAVELVVHADDVAATLSLPRPTFAPELTRRVIQLLVDTAVARHGDLAVVAAMTRRERDAVEALRVV